jgi:hypothetical protein
MCPLCLSAGAWLGLGGGSAASLAALIAVIRRKGRRRGAVATPVAVEDMINAPDRDREARLQTEL